MSLAVLDLIAPLTHEVQATLFSRADERNSVKEVQRMIDEMMLELKHAPFDTAVCLECKFNSAKSVELFPEYSKSPRCLAPLCFKQKAGVAVKAKIADLAKRIPDAVLYTNDVVTESPLKVMRPWDGKLVEASKENIKNGTYVHCINEKGVESKMQYVEKPVASKASKPAMKPELKKEGLAVAKTTLDLIAAVKAHNQLPKDFSIANYAALAVVFGAKFSLEKDDAAKIISSIIKDEAFKYDTPDYTVEDSWARFKMKSVKIEQAMWDRVREAMLDSINKKPTAVEALAEQDWMQYIANIIGFDLKASIKAKIPMKKEEQLKEAKKSALKPLKSTGITKQ